MSDNFFTPEEISELVVETADKILELDFVTELDKDPIRIIHRPLVESPTSRNPYKRRFFLTSASGFSCGYLINTEKDIKIKASSIVNTRGYTVTHFEESKNQPQQLLEIIKNYLLTCGQRIKENYIPDETERAVDFLGKGFRECLEWLIGCLDNHKYRGTHRLVFEDLSHG